MVEVDLIEQLVSSLEEALKRLEGAYRVRDVNYANRLRLYIFNVYQQIDEKIGGKK